MVEDCLYWGLAVVLGEMIALGRRQGLGRSTGDGECWRGALKLGKKAGIQFTYKYDVL